eukprot:scaffold47864_cov48-Attheya_sp.AAC.2
MCLSISRPILSCPVRLQNDPPSGVTGAPMDTNIMLWQAVIFGPDDTPWEGGTFKLVLEFSEDYPNKAPQSTRIVMCRIFEVVFELQPRFAATASIWDLWCTMY